MNEQERDFSTAKNILPLILKDVSHKGMQKGQLYRGWSDIVGESLSEKTRVLDIKNGIVLIAARDGGSMQLIMLKKNQILASLKKAYKGLDLHDLQVSLDKEGAQNHLKPTEKTSSTHATQNTQVRDPQEQDTDFQTLLKRIYSYGNKDNNKHA